MQWFWFGCFFVLILMCFLFFWKNIRATSNRSSSITRKTKADADRIQSMRTIRLNRPFSEQTRPTDWSEIVGQEDGIRLLRAAICNPFPQHVIIYGPPGVGKTASARLALVEACKSTDSAFSENAPFVEIDATIIRFDERGVADPLLGSVHDPLYQGAGALGAAGIPQPKPGAVSKAHGGILFLDEIGELHPHQLNKLLKVLEDGKVTLESAYYEPHLKHIPAHIHDIFQNGLPADFRMVGATTRTPEELPTALRSRCIEIFFQPLKPYDIEQIVETTIRKMMIICEPNIAMMIARYARNGREANQLLQLSTSVAKQEQMPLVSAELIQWIAHQIKLKPIFGTVQTLEFRK